MSNTDNKYTREGDDDSQVRNIIRRLNEEKPATEKSREVVVRADGTKAIRVTKKRKIMITNEEKSRRSRRSFVMLLLVGLLICGAVLAFFLLRLSAMTGENYLNEQENRLREAWGATSVHCSGASITGMQMTISDVIAEFPETSLVRRVEMSGISSTLSPSSFMSGRLRSDEVKIERVTIQLNENARTLSMPQHEGEELWLFKRVSCNDLSLYFGADEAKSPISLRKASAYMYGGGNSRAVMFNNGLLTLKGWKPITLTDGKMRISRTAIESLTLRGTTDPARVAADGRPETTVAFSGSITDSAPLAGPLMFDADNMSLVDFTEGRFTHFFSAFTVGMSKGNHEPTARVTLPLDAERPVFEGSFKVRDVRITSMPAMMLCIDHIDPKHRKRYMPPLIGSGTIDLSAPAGATKLSIAENEMVERDLLSLRAEVTVDNQNQLSGTIDYGMPCILTRVEYPDGQSDPIFTEDGRNAWMCTTVSGAANAPTDNSEQLEAAAVSARSFRPERTPFDRINVEQLSRQVSAAETQPVSQPANDTPAPAQQPATPQLTPAEEVPTTMPTGGGLTLPFDPSFDFGNPNGR